MARYSPGWRNVVVSIGFSAFGVLLLVLTVTAVVYGTGFWALKVWPLPRPWVEVSAESLITRVITAVCLGTASGGFFWLGYKALTYKADGHRQQQEEDHRAI
jgi:hypothetical protein